MEEISESERSIYYGALGMLYFFKASRCRLPDFAVRLSSVFFATMALAGCSGLVDNANETSSFRITAYQDALGYRFAYTQFLTNKRSQHKKQPLIVFLNGRGENGDDGLPLKNNFGAQVWEMQQAFPCIAIAPQCSVDGVWSRSSPDTQRAISIIEEVIQEYGIDQDRVYLTGVSSGGWGAWEIGSASAEMFAAVVPLCGGGGNNRGLVEGNMPIWNFCNDGDRIDLVEANRSLENSLTKVGLSPLYTEYHKSGHDCWNQGYRNKAMYEWLLQQSRAKNKLESEKFRLISKEISLQNETLSSEGDELLVESVNNAKPIACGEFPPLIDYHFHAKFVPGQTVALRLQSTNSDDQLVLHVLYAVDGPATFMKNSGNVFAYISPRAQNQLDSKGWNDIRLRVEKDRVSIMINGFHALDQQLDLSEIQGWNISLEPSAPEDTEMRFRYLRWRPLTWLMSSSN
jgi:predicted esterase